MTHHQQPAPIDREFSRQFRTGMRVFSAVHTFVYRLTGGRVFGRLGGAPVLLLTTVGRQTGKLRTQPLMYLADGDRYVVVGSAGGAPTHPAWVLNLLTRSYALVQVGSQRQEVLAHLAEGTERDRLWARAVALFPAFAAYQSWTSRALPVIVLRPIG